MKKYTFPFFPFTSKKLLKLFSTISRRLGASSFFSPSFQLSTARIQVKWAIWSRICVFFCFLVIRSGVPSSYYWLCFCFDAQRQNCLASAASLEKRRTYYYLPFFFFWYYGANAWEAPLPRRRAPAARQCVAMTFFVFFLSHSGLRTRAQDNPKE